MLSLFYKLLIGHVIADFALQGDTMGVWKSRLFYYANLYKVPNIPHWAYWLTAHAIIQGGFVYLITGNIFLGLVETALHWIIDWLKCEKITNIHIDQALHVFCKIMYSILLY